jgi:hypothetical protein
MQTVCGSHLARNKIKQPHVDAFHGPVLGFCILLFHFKIRQQWYRRLCSIRTQLSSTQRALAPPSLRVSSPPGCSTTRHLSTWTPCHPLPQICWQGQGESPPPPHSMIRLRWCSRRSLALPSWWMRDVPLPPVQVSRPLPLVVVACRLMRKAGKRSSARRRKDAPPRVGWLHLLGSLVVSLLIS